MQSPGGAGAWGRKRITPDDPHGYDDEHKAQATTHGSTIRPHRARPNPSIRYVCEQERDSIVRFTGLAWGFGGCRGRSDSDRGMRGTQQLLTLGGSSAHRSCAGLPTAHRTEFFLALFGSTGHLMKRFVCAQFGVPLSAKAISGGREVWSYGGGEMLTFKADRVLAASGEAHIGG